jgi:hypothetical protein
MRSTVPSKAFAAHLAAQEQVLGDGHGRGHGQVLVAAFDAGFAGVHRALEVHGLAVQQDLAFVGDGGARQALDEAALAGAVVADHGQDFAGAQFEVGAVQRGDLAVALDQALGLHHESWVVHVSAPPLRDSWSAATARITRMPVISTW